MLGSKGKVAKTRTGLIAALDIGSTKVSCFIGHANADGGIRVTGIGHHASSGVRGGVIVDMDAAQAAILTAVSAAEQRSGERLREVVVNLSGGKPASKTVAVEVSIAGHEVAEADLRRVVGYGYNAKIPADRELIHCFPVGYAIDAARGIRDPRGMYGDKLGVDMHLVTAAAGTLRNLATCVGRCHLDIETVVVAPYASGLACLVEDEKELGVTVIDMGGGTTSIAVFHDKNLVYTDSVPIGGEHVSRDVARGLSTTMAHAERMKTLYGSAIPSAADEQEIIDVPLIGEESHGQANHVPRSMLVSIIRPRLEETFELVRNRLDDSGAKAVAGRRLVLTGGACQLQGVRELAAGILEKQVRIGRPMRVAGLAEATSGPAFSACAGLLRYAIEKSDEPWSAAAAQENPTVTIGRISQWFRDNL
jgi:cell division protein FtsA